MKISEVAERSGVPASTLRYYERLGMLAARRNPNGYRHFDEDHLERLEFIASAKRLGLELPEIRDLLGTTRKFAVPLCEYLDRVGVTKRAGDLRVLAR